jgi:ribonuclease-3
MAARNAALERRIGYRFRDPALLAQALTHRGYGSPHNERLEFLGDAVLGCVVTEALYRSSPAVAEGSLSRLRAGLIREEALASVARGLGLSEFLRLDVSTTRNEGASRPSILADALEAVFGAVFLDGGYEAARGAIVHCLGASLTQADASAVEKDPKSRLQELLHAKRRALPQYRLVSTHGPKQRQTFEIECVLEDPALSARGVGSSRRRAEQQAAANLLKQLED